MVSLVFFFPRFTALHHAICTHICQCHLTLQFFFLLRPNNPSLLNTRFFLQFTPRASSFPTVSVPERVPALYEHSRLRLLITIMTGCNGSQATTSRFDDDDDGAGQEFDQGRIEKFLFNPQLNVIGNCYKSIRVVTLAVISIKYTQLHVL